MHDAYGVEVRNWMKYSMKRVPYCVAVVKALEYTRIALEVAEGDAQSSHLASSISLILQILEKLEVTLPNLASPLE
jgi:hypothetical protein